jgi:hypothetical protein
MHVRVVGIRALSNFARYPALQQIRIQYFSSARAMSSNHPNKNAEGGEFTSKVNKWLDYESDSRILKAKSKLSLERALHIEKI